MGMYRNRRDCKSSRKHVRATFFTRLKNNKETFFIWQYSLRHGCLRLDLRRHFAARLMLNTQRVANQPTLELVKGEASLPTRDL